jgi:hypothetical protein
MLTIFLFFSGFGVSAISLRNISAQEYSSLDEYDIVILVSEILSSLTEDNNSINENSILDNNSRIYGFIKYSNGSSVINSTVLLWEGSPWGFSHMPDYITNTDSNGYYEFENLSYGRYHIDPAKIGFKIGEKNVFLNEENPERKVDFTAVKSEKYQQSLIILLLLIILIISK